jgi:hypothetical protein
MTESDGHVSPAFLLRALLSGAVSYSQRRLLEKLVMDELYRIVLRNQSLRGWQPAGLGLDAADIATDIAADLLAGTCSLCTQLRIELQRTCDECAGDEQLLGAFNMILTRYAHTGYYRILRAYDGQYIVFQDALRGYARKAAHIRMTKSSKGFHYAHLDGETGRPRSAVATLEDLYAVSLGHEKDMTEHPVVHTLLRCLDFLERSEYYRVCVHEKDIISLTIRYLASAYAPEDETQPDNPDQRIIFSTAVRMLCEHEYWLRRQYVGKGRLTEAEASAFVTAKRRWLEDGCDGKLASYLYAELPEHQTSRYREQYRSMFEYSIKRYFRILRVVLATLGYRE